VFLSGFVAKIENHMLIVIVPTFSPIPTSPENRDPYWHFMRPLSGKRFTKNIKTRQNM